MKIKREKESSWKDGITTHKTLMEKAQVRLAVGENERINVETNIQFSSFHL